MAAGGGEEEEAGGLLFHLLPPELLLMVLSDSHLTSRDLVALELADPRLFHQQSGDRTLSLTEQAAKKKLLIADALPNSLLADNAGDREDYDAHDTEDRCHRHDPESTSNALNWKSLVHYLLEKPALPVFRCELCQWAVGGFRCKGRRPAHPVRAWEEGDRSMPDDDLPPVPEPSGCGCYFVWSASTERLLCPAGCGWLSAPVCSCITEDASSQTKSSVMVPLAAEQKYDLRTALGQLYESSSMISQENGAFLRRGSPSLTCTRCGLTVSGYACLGCRENRYHRSLDRPQMMVARGFGERDRCCYRWGCQICPVIRSGPEITAPSASWTGRTRSDRDPAFLCCVSRTDCQDGSGKNGRGTEMAALEWLDTFGPPSVDYSYRCIKPKQHGDDERMPWLD